MTREKDDVLHALQRLLVVVLALFNVCAVCVVLWQWPLCRTQGTSSRTWARKIHRCEPLGHGWAPSDYCCAEKHTGCVKAC